MVERWMKGRTIKSAFKGNRAYYGKPAQLFKDSDKDGVANVFDCKPYNRRRQDVISPVAGQAPINDMWGRQEQNRLFREQQRKLDELRQQEEEKLKELQRLSNVTVVDNTKHYYNETWGAVSPSTGVAKTFPTAKEALNYSKSATPAVKSSGVTIRRTVVDVPKPAALPTPSKASTNSSLMGKVISKIITRTPILPVVKLFNKGKK